MKDTGKNFYKFIFCFVLLLVAFIPTLKTMFERWVAPESYYGHGFLIPIVSLFVIWQRRDILKKTRISSEMAGLWIIAAALFVNVICAALKVYFVSGFSFVFVLYGLVLFFFGREMARNLIFPIFFLLAMVPLPLVVVGNLTVKLKLFAAQCATFLLNRIGFPSRLDGSTILMPASFTIVEAPCSGLRSLISLLTLGLLFAYAMKGSYGRKGLLLLSSVPIAMATNVCRIAILAIVNDLYGEKVAMGWFHDFSGFLVFALAFILLLAVSNLLQRGVAK